MLRDARIEDSAALRDVYAPFVEETHYTFEEVVPSVSAMSERVAAAGPRHPWLVLEEGGEVVGYACAVPWKARAAYSRSVESSIYLAPSARGRGAGTLLYSALLDRLAATDVRAVLAGIALPNPASIALHEKLGYTAVGQLREVGRKFGRWIDVGYWERVLSYSWGPGCVVGEDVDGREPLGEN